MRKPKENKEKFKMKSPEKAKEMYLRYMEGILCVELQEGLGFKVEF